MVICTKDSITLMRHALEGGKNVVGWHSNKLNKTEIKINLECGIWLPFQTCVEFCFPKN